MDVAIVPVLSDNYAYLLIDTANPAIDPVEPSKVLARANELGVEITAVLTTHGHWDHAGGNAELKRLVEAQQQQKQQQCSEASHDIPVIGGADDNVQAATRSVSHGDVVHVGTLAVEVLHTPCHTRGHVLYRCGDALFTGDTLFVAGCGRFFSGVPAEMHHALNTVVAQLPRATKIYCGHEYTVSNLRFAAHVEPENAAVQHKLAWATEQTQRQQPTVPSTLDDELATNPFMRVHEPAVQRFALGGESEDLVAVMGALRAAKDAFGVGKGKI